MTVESETLAQKIKESLRKYAGFVLGALTIPVMYTYQEPLPSWQANLYLGPAFFPPTWVLVPMLVNNVLANIVAIFYTFGFYNLLGGLLGTHRLRNGLLICIFTVTFDLIISILISGGIQLNRSWNSWIVLLASYLAVFLGAVVPYLLGFSLRRLLVLSVLCQPVK